MSDKRVIVQNRTEFLAAGNADKPKTPKEYLSQGWMPTNSEVLTSLIAKVKNGTFENNRKGLVTEIKKDISILSFLMKELTVDEEFVQNPIKLIEVAPISVISESLDKAAEVVNSFSLNQTLKPQALRIKQSLISCSAAEMMAKSRGLDSDMAYSAAVIRQMGLNLVAWNYPRIYGKALAQLPTSQEDIETMLHRWLGFSPRQIASSLTICSPSPDMKIALGLEDNDSDSLGKAIAEISDLAESFAQANDPENFPGQTRRWKTIEHSLQMYLGPKATTLIQDRVKSFGNIYASVPHSGIDTPLSLEINLEVANRKQADIYISQNPAACKINSDLQTKIKKMYTLVRPNEVSPEALQILILDCIPSAGFKRGCVFLYDQEHQMLIPKLKIGDRSLEEYKGVHARGSIEGDNAVLEALQSSVPIKKESTVIFGERASVVAGLIGNNEKSGVLYLEMSEELEQAGGFEPVQRFKALRNCLNHCLNLKGAQYL